jgi:ABC-type branched-subunit amino acid transport system ATPase component
MSFGGVTAKQAAHFQLVVVIMATLCSVSASLFSCVAEIESSFGPREIFVSHVFPHGKKKGVISISLWLWSVLSGSTKEPREFAPHNFRQSENDEIRRTKMELMGPSLSFIRLEHFSDEAPILFEATGFALEGWIEDMYDDTALAQQTLTIRLGDVLELQGRDRLIKTECFRAFAGLHSNFRGNMTLAGASWNTTRSKDVAEWRRSVIFLPENRPRIGGNPLQFLKRVAGFRSWSRNSHSNEEDRARRLIHDVSDYLLHWGMSLESLNREWGTLPDEEAYMVLMSTALASRPKMLLLEPPASLSTDAKAAIDRSVWAYADEQRGSVLLISTDSSDDGEA